MLLAACGIIVAMPAIWISPTRSAALADWDPAFELMLGNETTGDRPWRGEIGDWVFLRGAWTPQEMAAHRRAGVDGTVTIEDDTLGLRIKTADLVQSGPALVGAAVVSASSRDVRRSSGP